MRNTIGRLGELLVEQQLLERGWHPIRLDTAQTAPNADLLAIKNKQRVCLQVKTTDAKAKHSHFHSLHFGYAAKYLRKSESIFNSKQIPLSADVVVGVSYNPLHSRFAVMPVAFAEKLCREKCDFHFAVPRRDGKQRSPSFPIYLRFTKTGGKSLKQHHEKEMRNLLAFEDRWDILSEPIDRLHDEKIWNLID